MFRDFFKSIHDNNFFIFLLMTSNKCSYTLILDGKINLIKIYFWNGDLI